MKKRVLIFVLALIMLVSMMSVTAYADDGEKPDEYWATAGQEASWSLNEKKGYSVDKIDRIDGDLPDGMSTEIDNWGRLILSGTPASAGDFRVNFSLEVNDGKDSWGTGLMCIFHIDGGRKEDYTLPAYYEVLNAGQEYWIPFDMGCSGSITNYKLKSGNLPDGMYGDMDKNGLYLGGTPCKGGVYEFTIAAYDGRNECWANQPITITVKGNAAPTITKQPTGETITEGGQNSFIARAINSNKITWRFVSPDSKTTIKASDGPGYFSGLQVSGTDKEQLYISNVPYTLNGWTAEAMFEGPGGVSYSDGAVIKVRRAELKLPILKDSAVDGKLNPGETVTLKSGETVTLIVSATSPDGNKLSYQWYENDKNSSSGGRAIPGATSESYNITFDKGSAYYYCMVYNNRDGEISDPVTSAPAAILEAPTPTPAPTEKPEETQPAETPAPAQPAETPAPAKAEVKSEKADHTVAYIIGAVAAVALICATLIIIQRGAAKRYPERYSEQIKRAEEYRQSHRHIK